MATATTVIAVLDDEPQIGRALRRVLAANGLRARVFARAEELYEAMDRETFGCLVLDLQMPGATGFDVMRTLAERRVPTPVVVITGHDEPGQEAQARATGAVEYLRKPVDETTLREAIERAAPGLRTTTS